jgi:hypothetical protein
LSDYIWRHVGRNRMPWEYAEYHSDDGCDEFSLVDDKRVWVVTYGEYDGIRYVTRSGAPFSRFGLDTPRFLALDAWEDYDINQNIFTVRVPVSLFVCAHPTIGKRVLGKRSKYFQQCLSLALYAQMMIGGESTKSFPWWRKTGSIDREYER